MRNMLLALLAGLLSVNLQAADNHISDEVTVFMHSGPSNQYRIRSNVPSGTMVDVLSRNAETGYVQVRLPGGTEGWVQGKYIDKGESDSARLPKLEKALAVSQQLNNEQSEALAGLESDLKKANDKQAQGTAEVAQLENEVERLKLQIDSMDERNLMGWMLRGGALALGGVLLGLIVPHLPKRRRRNNDWF